MARLTATISTRFAPNIKERVILLTNGKVLVFWEFGQDQRVAGRASLRVFSSREVWEEWDRGTGAVRADQVNERDRKFWKDCEIVALRKENEFLHKRVLEVAWELEMEFTLVPPLEEWQHTEWAKDYFRENWNDSN